MVDSICLQAETVALEIARQIAEQAKKHKILQIRHKSDPADLVTDYDFFNEDFARQTIMKEFPDHTIVAEERGQSGPIGGHYTWYVDPIDGTCNFAHGIAWSSFSIALVKDGIPVVGVVADLFRDEIFHAVAGYGAYCNGKSIQVRRDASVEGHVVMAELANHRWWKGLEQLSEWLENKLCTLRIMGSSALSLANVAAARASACVLGGSNPIDVAAGVLIAREAGAIVIDRHGGRDGLPSGGLVAGKFDTADMIWQVVFSQHREATLDEMVSG